MVTMSDPLAIYLNDHMAGAGVAIDLLKTMKERHDASLSQFAASILVEVEEDEETLRSIAKNIGSGSNVFKEAAAWLAEKASRLKLGQVRRETSAPLRYSNSSRLEFRGSSVFGPRYSWSPSLTLD